MPYFTDIIGSSSVKRLHIDTDMLLIVTSTSGVLFRGINLDDLKRPLTPRKIFLKIVAILI